MTGMTMLSAPVQTLQDFLLTTRLVARLTTRTMGDAMEISPGTVSKWERGQGEPSVTQFIRWCHVTGQEPEQMIAVLERLVLAGTQNAPVTGESDTGRSYTPRDLNPEPTDYESEAAAFWAIVADVELPATAL